MRNSMRLAEVNKRFNEAIAHFDQLATDFIFNLGRPGPILQACGLINREIQLTRGRLREKLSKHGYPIALLENLPVLIQDPLLVTKYKGNVFNVVVPVCYYDAESHENQPLLIGIEVDSTNQTAATYRVNAVLSVFPKHPQNIFSWILEKRPKRQCVVYVNKEGNLSSLTRKGHQSPSARACPDSLPYSARVQDALRDATLYSDIAKVVKDFHNPISEGDVKAYRIDLQEEMKGNSLMGANNIQLGNLNERLQEAIRLAYVVLGIKPQRTDKSGRKPSATAKTSSAIQTIDIPLEDVHTDEKRFQNRKKQFSQASFDEMVSNFDPNAFDPINVWQDPTDHRYYVLSGHSRLAAFRELNKRHGDKFAKIPARIITGTEQYAIDYARNSNSRSTPEEIWERAKYYRELINEGRSKKEIEDLAERRERRNKNDVLALAYLPESGQLAHAPYFRGDEKATSEQFEYELKVAVWVGSAFRACPDLSKIEPVESVHFRENELARYVRNVALSKRGGKNKFLREVRKAVANWKEELDKWEKDTNPLKPRNCPFYMNPDNYLNVEDATFKNQLIKNKKEIEACITKATEYIKDRIFKLCQNAHFSEVDYHWDRFVIEKHLKDGLSETVYEAGKILNKLAFLFKESDRLNEERGRPRMKLPTLFGIPATFSLQEYKQATVGYTPHSPSEKAGHKLVLNYLDLYTEDPLIKKGIDKQWERVKPVNIDDVLDKLFKLI